jgi:hypothetical protein
MSLRPQPCLDPAGSDVNSEASAALVQRGDLKSILVAKDSGRSLRVLWGTVTQPFLMGQCDFSARIVAAGSTCFWSAL